MSKLEVDAIEPQSGTTITIGSSGDTVNLVGTLNSNGSPLPGDISSVVAGTGLSGGGQTGAVTLNIDSAQPTITSLGTLTSATISGNLTVDTNTLIIDSSLNNVTFNVNGFTVNGSSFDINTIIYPDGIAMADSRAISFGTDSDFELSHSLSGDDILKLNLKASDNHFAIYDSSTELVRFTGTGNVGIGETAPLGKLHVKSADSGVSSVNAGANELIVENSGDAGITIASGSTSFGKILFADSSNNADGQILYDQNSRSLNIYTAGTERMRIDSAGSLGLGTSSPFNSRPGAFTISNEAPTIYMEDTNGSGSQVGQLLYQDAVLSYSIGSRNGTGTTNSTELLKINNAGKIFTRQTAQFDDCVTIGGGAFTGDFQIEVSGLTAVTGNQHKSLGMRLTYRGIAADATNGQNKDVLLFISGLSSWSSVGSIDTGGGTVAITVDSATTTAVTFTVTSPASTCVGAYVATLFANDNSTMECNG